jgi:hypothetical protein
MVVVPGVQSHIRTKPAEPIEKDAVHHYGANGHVRKTQRRVRYNLSVFSLPHYLDIWLLANGDDEASGKEACK